MKFARLIRKHSRPITILRDETGSFHGPRWVPGAFVKYEVSAAPFFLTPEDLRHYEGLNYTTQDLKLFVVEDLTATKKVTGKTVSFELQEGDLVLFRDKRYKIDTAKDSTVHADFYTYIARLMPKEAEGHA